MNIKTKTLSTEELFKFIYSDYQYLVQNPNGNSSCHVSQDILDYNILYCLQLAEEFVESVSKSKELPFDIKKNLEDTFLKILPLGEQFYKLLVYKTQKTAMNIKHNQTTLSFSNFISPEGQMDLSENLKVLCDVENRHGLPRVNFSYNPRSIISTNGLLEGELINGFVIRLREAIQRKPFKDKRDERKKSLMKRFNKAKRCIMSLYESTPRLFDVDMTLSYKRNALVDNMSLLESCNHFNKFIKELREDASSGPLVGWCWKREYMTETNYRYHLLLFFDEQKIVNDLHQIRYTLYERWNSITNDQGASYLQNLIPGATYNSRMESNLRLVQHMLMRDIFIRLKPHTKFDHFGMGSSTLSE